MGSGMEQTHTTSILNGALHAPAQQDVAILIDFRRFLRDCLSYRLKIEGFETVCFDTVDDSTLEPVPQASVIIFYSDDAPDRVRADIDRLSSKFENKPLLIISSEDDLARIVTLLRMGVRGYIPQNSTINDVLGAIRLVQAGGTYIPANSVLAEHNQPQKKIEPAWAANFTPKQAAIIEGIRRGKPNKVIAYELCMCESTVKVHIRNVMRKLKVRNRTELAYRMAEQTTAVSHLPSP